MSNSVSNLYRCGAFTTLNFGHQHHQRLVSRDGPRWRGRRYSRGKRVPQSNWPPLSSHLHFVDCALGLSRLSSRQKELESAVEELATARIYPLVEHEPKLTDEDDVALPRKSARKA